MDNPGDQVTAGTAPRCRDELWRSLCNLSRWVQEAPDSFMGCGNMEDTQFLLLSGRSLRWRNHRISISVTCLNSSRIMRSPASQVSHQETEVMTNLRFLKREWLWGFPGAQLTWSVSLGFGCKFKKHKRQGWLLEPGPPLNSLPSQTLLLSTWFSFWSLSSVLLCYLGRQCKNESRITLIQNQVRCLSLPKSLSITYQSKCLFLGMLVTKQQCKGTTCPNPWVFCFRQNPIWKTEPALGL